MLEVVAGLVAKELDRVAAAHNGGVGRNGEQVVHVAGVVGLGVIDDDVFDLFGIDHLLDFFEVGRPEFHLGRFNDRFFLGIDEIRIVRGAVLGFHDDIEGDKARIEHANP